MASTLLAAGMTLILSTQLTCTQVCDRNGAVLPAMPAAAEDAPVFPPGHPIYKGLVGNLLEGVSMDAERRVELQRASTAISAPFTGRSIALLLGLGNPVLFMAGGAIWGVWSASRVASGDAGPAVAMPFDGHGPNGLQSAMISD